MSTSGVSTHQEHDELFTSRQTLVSNAISLYRAIGGGGGGGITV